MSAPLNLDQYDSFSDERDSSTGEAGSEDNFIHIRVQQRNARKSLTTLQGLPKERDPKQLLRTFKKGFACGGNLVSSEELGRIIQLQGDQRVKISTFLADEGHPKDMIKIHGVHM